MSIGILSFYYIVDPNKKMVSPPCLSKLFFNLDCPLCGGQRSLHHLLHGELDQAWHMNQLFISAMAIALVIFIWNKILHYLWLDRTPIRFRNGYIWVALGISIIFTILRNI